MDLEFILMQMDLNIKGIGKKINKMEKENNFVQMEAGIKVTIRMELNKEKEFFIGKIVLFFKEILLIIEHKDLEFIIGMMVENIKVNGLEIK